MNLQYYKLEYMGMTRQRYYIVLDYKKLLVKGGATKWKWELCSRAAYGRIHKGNANSKSEIYKITNL